MTNDIWANKLKQSVFYQGGIELFDLLLEEKIIVLENDRYKLAKVYRCQHAKSLKKWKKYELGQEKNKPNRNNSRKNIYSNCKRSKRKIHQSARVKAAMRPQATGILIGRLAEILIVRNCRKSRIENRKWANFARKKTNLNCPFVEAIDNVFWENPDKYIAVARGSYSTFNSDYSGSHNPISSDDICWVHQDTYKNLKNVDSNSPFGRYSAGIQVKTGHCYTDAQSYFYERGSSEIYPMVFFDFRNDYEKLVSSLINGKPREGSRIFDSSIDEKMASQIIAKMLVRGRDMDAYLQEEMLFYRDILAKVFSKRIKLIDLKDESIILNLVERYFERHISRFNSLHERGGSMKRRRYVFRPEFFFPSAIQLCPIFNLNHLEAIKYESSFQERSRCRDNRSQSFKR